MRQGERLPLALQLVLAGKHVAQLIERSLAGRGLNHTQARVLTLLSHHPGVTILQLSAPVGVEPANITRTIQALERLGTVERRPHPTDGRASLLYLTPTGTRLAQDLAVDMESLSTRLFQGVAPEQLAVLERVLAALMADFGCELAPEGSRPSAAGSGAPHPDAAREENRSEAMGDSEEHRTAAGDHRSTTGW